MKKATICELIKEIEKWSEKYDFTFQFWKDSNTVYIEKRDVELYTTGGCLDMREVLILALTWIYKVNVTQKNEQINLN